MTRQNDSISYNISINSGTPDWNDYTHIFAIGHSYGGWLTMKLMEDWIGNQNTVKTVYTLDPISKELCFFDNPSQCVNAPNDISETSHQHSREFSALWVNQWQKNALFLHSSRISEADLNPKHDLTHWSMLPNNDI